MFEFFQNIYPAFLEGLLITLELAGVSLLIGFLIGVPTAFAKVYGRRWVRLIANIYTDIFRGTPLLVQLFVVYYGLPDFGITLSRIAAALLTLGLNSGAYQAEYFRAAIQAIGQGQMMAARSIGMSRLKAIRYIILPQALRAVIPAWSNEPVSLLKASAVAFLIAVPDLMTKAKILITRTYDPLPAYFTVAAIYIFIVLLITAGLNLIENRLRIPGLQVGGSRR